MTQIQEILSLAREQIKRKDLIAAEGTLKRCYDIAPGDLDVTGTLYELYQRNIESLKTSPYMDYPLFVSVETSTLCNAKCTFCPYPTLERIGNKMPDEVIDKIISDLKSIPINVEFRFAPFKVSDPFTELRLFPIIE